jgi:hypothetical protein
MPSLDDQIAEYRQLVTAEASEETLQAALALIESLLDVRLPVPEELQVEGAELDDEELEESRLQVRLKDEVLRFIEPRLTVAREKRTRRRQRLKAAALAYRTGYALAVPGMLRRARVRLPRSVHSLLLDTCLVVFHQVCFLLLARGDAAQNAWLVARCQDFLTHVTRRSDEYRLRAVLADSLGHARDAEAYYQAALDATPAHEHEFITLLQATWQHYIDSGRFGRASVLLVDAIPRLSEADFLEAQEMMRITMDLSRATVSA